MQLQQSPNLFTFRVIPFSKFNIKILTELKIVYVLYLTPKVFHRILQNFIRKNSKTSTKLVQFVQKWETVKYLLLLVCVL